MILPAPERIRLGKAGVREIYAYIPGLKGDNELVGQPIADPCAGSVVADMRKEVEDDVIVDLTHHFVDGGIRAVLPAEPCSLCVPSPKGRNRRQERRTTKLDITSIC